MIGGCLTGAVAFLNDRSRERRAARTSARLVREDLLDVALALEDALAGRVRALQPEVAAGIWRDERRSLAGVMSYSDYAKAAEGVKVAVDARELIEGLPASEEQLRQRLSVLSDGLYALLTVARDGG